MTIESDLVFVTGASGYLAAHVIDQLVSQGYRVRASARASKLDKLKEIYKAVPSVEIVQIDDIAQGDFREVLRGSTALIHTASPLAGAQEKESMLKTAIEGSLNVVRQAYEVGVKKFVVTSSISAVTGDYTPRSSYYSWNDWNPIDKESASGVIPVYEAAKKYAELAVWDWAKEHPDVDVTTVAPPLFYGPFAPHSIKPARGEYTGIGTNLFVYHLLHKSGSYPFSSGYIDVRDVAKLHVGALTTTSGASASTPEHRRIVASSPYGLDFKVLNEEILSQRPELKERWTTTPAISYPGGDRFGVDFEKIKDVTGVAKEGFHSAVQTFVDAIDYLVTVEEDWKKEGYSVPDSLPVFV